MQGIQPNIVEQIEQTVVRLNAEFGLTIALVEQNVRFCRCAAKRFHIFEKGRPVAGGPIGGLTEELLSPSLGGAFEMIRSVFEPGADSGGPRPAPDRENGGVVVEGRLVLEIAGRAFDLGPGDSFQFAGADYAWRNPGPERAVVIWVVSPPVY